MWICKDWKDYEILDISSGDKLEVWNGYKLIRPDPQVIWDERQFPALWKDAHARYNRSKSGGGSWDFNKKLPDQWDVNFEPLGLKFLIKPMGFKHTGLFPEQAANWMWFSDIIKKAAPKRPVKVLNLFAYTGGATVAAAAAGASVVHVDSSKGMVTWAKENLNASGHGDKFVRFIVDDAIKFVEREIRRGNRYDGIIMDPPSYGRGPGGEVWKIEDEIYPLVQKCSQILSDNPLFFLINSYTTGLQASVLTNILTLTVGKKYKGTIVSDELGLPVKNTNLVLPCGASGRFEAEGI
ncbi:MAG: class I SAM-dependent methyltransferase [Clostridia bacterium]|nr:class I SAM-dependent methyltransferase [Clostridia bacterium]